MYQAYSSQQITCFKEVYLLVGEQQINNKYIIPDKCDEEKQNRLKGQKVMRGRVRGTREKLRITPINSSTNNPLSSQIEIEKGEFFFPS